MIKHKFPYLWKLKELPPPLAAMCSHALHVAAVVQWAISWQDST